MTVASILKSKGGTIYTARPDQTLDTATGILRQRGIGAVVVVDVRGLPVGILSERDIVRALADNGATVLDRPVEDFMTADVITGSTADSVDEVMEKMTKRRIRHLPIIDQGKLVGIVSIGDVVSVKIQNVEAEAEALKSYIAT